jgi:serine phosphatase RsbU (regulator of sigma subunit)
MNRSGEIDCVLESSGPPLGLFDDSQFVTSVAAMKSEQLLILLTDGATETTTSQDVQFGTDGVLEYVRAHRQKSAGDLAEGIYRAARNFAGDNSQQDDVTEVVVRVA